MKIDKCNLQTTTTFLAIITFLSILIACNQGGKNATSGNVVTNLFTKSIIDENELGKNINTFLNDNAKGFVYNKDSIKNIKEIADLYLKNKNLPIWLNGNGINKNAITLLQQIKELASDGLNIKQFKLDNLQNLQKLIEAKNINDSIAKYFEIGLSITALKACNAMMQGQYKSNDFNEDWFNKTDTQFVASTYLLQNIASDSIGFLFNKLRPTMPEYAKFKQKLKELITLQKNGGWGVVNGLADSIEDGTKSNQILALRKRLCKEIGIPKDTNSNEMASDLLGAIQSFQYLHDLKLTGKLDTATVRRLNMPIADKIKNIKSNLERLRWLPQHLQQPYVWVNIPKMELQYIDKDSSEYKMRVVVGRLDRPTPTLDATMSNVVINPNWSVPPTIMKEEVVPGIGRRGSNYLSRRGLKAYYHGHEVSANRINSKNYKAFSIQQKPGLNSALGAVKFNMPNSHAIYLHDTPHRGDFVKYYRAYSSGCIRVEKPRDFAQFVLQDSNYTSTKIDSYIHKKITREVPLKKRVDVHIVYLTNGLDSLGNVLYLRDIYSKDGAMKGLW